jgi:hypothetical protein
MTKTNTLNRNLEPNLVQCCFGHLNFGHLILFRISDFEIRIFKFFRTMTLVL